MCAKKKTHKETKNILLFDDALTFQKNGFTLTLNSPSRRGEPVLTPEMPWERAGIIGDSNLSVIQESGIVRLWYGVGMPRSKPEGASAVSRSALKKLDKKTRLDILSEEKAMLCYAESPDGLKWVKPSLGVFKHEGSLENNIVWIDRLGATVFTDPSAKEKERYKMIYGGLPRVPHVYACDNKIPVSNVYCAVYGARSSDGVHWLPYEQPVVPWYTDTTNVCYWDDRIGKYVAFVRWNEDMAYKEGRTVIVRPGGWKYRAIGRAESRDFRNFPPPEKIAEPSREEREPRDKGFDYYNSSAVKYPFAEDSYFMFSSNYYHDSDMADVQLGTSRDGIHYSRWRGPFLGIGAEGCFDSKMIFMATGLYRSGDEIWMYYTGSNNFHNVTNPAGRYSGVGMARIRLDGFVSQDADWAGGSLTTIPLLFSGDKLTINYDANAGGWMKVELLDKEFNPIPGFSEMEADYLRGNNIRKTATWKNGDNIAPLNNKFLSLRFIGCGVKIYSFQFVEN